MSSIYKSLIVALVLIILFAGYFYTQVDWEARAVRKQLDQLVELVEKDGAISKFEAVGRSRQLPDFFVKNPSVEYYPNRRLPRDSDAISGAFLSVWGQLDSASARVIRHEVEIGEDASEAESNAVVRSSVIMGGSEQMGNTLKYRIYWTKIEGDWRIREVLALGSQ
jgi:hypothetical protein